VDYLLLAITGTHPLLRDPRNIPHPLPKVCVRAWRMKQVSSLAHPASDPAQNPYWQRDVRRAYPRLSVITQSDLSSLLLQAPETEGCVHCALGSPCVLYNTMSASLPPPKLMQRFPLPENKSYLMSLPTSLRSGNSIASRRFLPRYPPLTSVGHQSRLQMHHTIPIRISPCTCTSSRLVDERCPEFDSLIALNDA
jgi:hypothetical protein